MRPNSDKLGRLTVSEINTSEFIQVFFFKDTQVIR
jgi:hypothetical protein